MMCVDLQDSMLSIDGAGSFRRAIFDAHAAARIGDNSAIRNVVQNKISVTVSMR